MPGRNNQADGDDDILRRRFIQGFGAVGLTASLAGCGGQSAGGDTGGTQSGSVATTQKNTGTPDQSGKPKDDTLSVAQWAVPKDSQYNPYNDKNGAEPRRVLYDRFMKYNLQKREYTGYAISDWSADGSEVSLTVRDGLKWHDGDDVTATDLVTKLKLDLYTGGSLSNYVDEISKAVTKQSEKKVTLKLSQKVNEEIVLALLQPKRMNVKHAEYKKHLQAFEQASGDEEISKAQDDLFNRKVKEPIGSGPFTFENADSRRTLLTKFDDHPDAKMINFPKMEYLYLPSNQKRWDALINGKTDGSATLFMPRNKLNQLPDSVRVGLIARHTGLGLVFNHEHEHYGQRTVRQAIAYVIDRQAVATNSGAGTDSKIPVEIPSGLTKGQTNAVKDKWLNGVAGKFNKYETNTEKAASLLRDAGFEKSGGTWQDENGKPLKAPVKAPSGFTDWVTAAETFVSHLKEFGIQAQLLAKDTSTYWGKDWANGNFTLALGGWSDYSQSYPFFHFDYLYDSTDSKSIWKAPREFDVAPLSNPSGSKQSVKPADLVQQLSQAKNEKQAIQTIQKLAWVTNRELPVLPLQEKLAQTFLTDDDWNVPPRNSPKLQVYWPAPWLTREGDWSAKRK
ncbi:ABC transporter substrate-binding protein [Haladaptatus sp. NG-WS-4]